MTRTVLRKCSPNAHGPLKLVHDDGALENAVDDAPEEGGFWYVREPHDGPDYASVFDSLAEAEAFYDERLAYWSNEPNWEAQDRYDDAHGTVNGYSPWQLSREW